MEGFVRTRDADIIQQYGGNFVDNVANGSTVGDVRHVARQLLGLTYEEANGLFDPDLSRERMRQVVKELLSL